MFYNAAVTETVAAENEPQIETLSLESDADTGDPVLSSLNTPADPPRTEQRISEAARLGFRRIIVSGYLAKGGKRPKGIEVVPINSVDQLPKALFTE